MAVSIVMHLVYFAPAVIFGLYYFLRGDISISGFKNLLSSKEDAEDRKAAFENPKLRTEA